MTGSRICVLLLLRFVPGAIAFVTMSPTPPRICFAAYKEASAGKDAACVKAITSAKYTFDYITKEAKVELARSRERIDGVEAKVTYIEAVETKLRRSFRTVAEKAVSDADDIRRKAIGDMEALADLAVAAEDGTANAVNSTGSLANFEAILEEIKAIKAKALNDIDVIRAELDQHKGAVVAKFEKLIEVV
jgi:Xaa-Pro aminopeptidase